MITPQNLHKQKMSTLFLSVLEDLRKAQQAGFEVNMQSWANNNWGQCSICLGGASLMGFVPIEEIKKDSNKIANQIDNLVGNDRRCKIDGVHFNKSEVERASQLAFMFNDFRQAYFTGVFDHYNNLTEIRTYRIDDELQDDIRDKYRAGGIKAYSGYVVREKLRELKKDIKRFARILIKHGK